MSSTCLPIFLIFEYVTIFARCAPLSGPLNPVQSCFQNLQQLSLSMKYEVDCNYEEYPGLLIHIEFG